MTFQKGNIPVNKLPDEIAACNLIKRVRLYARHGMKHKSVSIPLRKFGLRAQLIITYRRSTGHVSLAHTLMYHQCGFSPTTHQKLICTNQHALNVLNINRKRNIKKVQR